MVSCTVAVALVSGNRSNVAYALLVSFIVTQILFCQAAMKYRMSIRQKECDGKTGAVTVAAKNTDQITTNGGN